MKWPQLPPALHCTALRCLLSTSSSLFIEIFSPYNFLYISPAAAGEGGAGAQQQQQPPARAHAAAVARDGVQPPGLGTRGRGHETRGLQATVLPAVAVGGG